MNIPLSAEPVATLFGFTFTNSLINAVVAAIFFIVLAVILRGKSAMVPRGIQNFFEMILEGMLDFMDQVTHDREKSKKFLPIVGTLFLFILVSNWMGLIPGVGSIGVWQVHHGENALIPLFRPATSDLNLTIGLAVMSVLLSHIIGAFAVGFFAYGNKFIKLGDLWKALVGFTTKKFGDAAIGLLTAIIEMAVGLIELSSEVAKMLSLSLRLFGNIFAGEVLITVIASIAAYIVPLPFMSLEIIVGVVQALVFSTLVLVYLTIAVEAPHGSEEHDAKKHEAHA